VRFAAHSLEQSKLTEQHETMKSEEEENLHSGRPQVARRAPQKRVDAHHSRPEPATLLFSACAVLHLSLPLHTEAAAHSMEPVLLPDLSPMLHSTTDIPLHSEEYLRHVSPVCLSRGGSAWARLVGRRGGGGVEGAVHTHRLEPLAVRDDTIARLMRGEGQAPVRDEFVYS
jgi:hypothetical protein